MDGKIYMTLSGHYRQDMKWVIKPDYTVKLNMQLKRRDIMESTI